MFSNAPRISLVVATRDRAREVRRLLGSLAEQSRPPERIIVVDGGVLPAAGVIAEFPSLSLLYVKSPVASAADQRNLGIDALGHLVSSPASGIFGVQPFFRYLRRSRDFRRRRS
jgi:hypothetical protein